MVIGRPVSGPCGHLVAVKLCEDLAYVAAESEVTPVRRRFKLTIPTLLESAFFKVASEEDNDR